MDNLTSGGHRSEEERLAAQESAPKNGSDLEKESRETISNLPDLGDFLKFIESDDFKKQLSDKEDPQAVFYDFCTMSKKNVVEINRSAYEDKTSDRLHSTGGSDVKKLPEVKIYLGGFYWLRGKSQDLSENEPKGRLYLNLDPDSAHAVFDNILTESSRNNIPLKLKMPANLNERSAKRIDKMIIYFNESYGDKIVQIISRSIQELQNAYDISSPDKKVMRSEEIPRFTQKVKGVDGKIMSGVGFGEEPSIKNESFSKIRSCILTDLYYALSEGQSLSDSLWKNICSRYKVDPENPAFNSGKQTERFKYFR